MTYYYLFIIVAMVIAFCLTPNPSPTGEGRWKHVGKAVAACVAAAAIAICLNLSNLYHTWQYGQESMRGKSELVKQDTGNQTSSGLERDYITQWSYGIDETWTLLVPNTKGGASVPLSRNATAMAHADNNFIPIYQQIGQYWGEQPGTQGPVYVGAFVLMLFILGLFIVKGPVKWALLAATILSILLSWGKNFMGLTDFFIDYVPMYAKFRTVASILVIAEFTIPLLAVLALKECITKFEVRHTKSIAIAFALTGGICLLFALMPGVFFDRFVSTSELQAMSQIPQDQLQPLLQNLTEMRRAMFTADCWRSFVIIAIGTLCLLLYKSRKLKQEYMVGALLLLCLIDLWQVNKRYLNDEMFVPKSEREQPIQKTTADDQILQDKTPDFRVLNFATNTFNENETSYYHKSIGGYHAAKLRRYQELVETHISGEMQATMKAISEAGGDMTLVNGDSIYPILNMLNTRYFILPLQTGQTVPLQNPYTYGNAWIVNHVDFVPNANKEIEALPQLDLRHEAVADEQFRDILGESQMQDTASIVKLTSYEPNRLTYDVNSGKGGVIVFSEIYYPGWSAIVDGKPAELGRVNYVLRALKVSPGTHQVELTFYPKSVDNTETVAYISYAVLLLMIGVAVYMSRRKKQQDQS